MFFVVETVEAAGSVPGKSEDGCFYAIDDDDIEHFKAKNEALEVSKIVTDKSENCNELWLSASYSKFQKFIY